MGLINRRDFVKATSAGGATLGLTLGPAAQAQRTGSGSSGAGNSDLRFRQVHLDFHTSELIEGIGVEFDPEEFADTLASAHVDSITCFGRGHHGYIYFDTRLFPERRHPHMKKSLLPRQIEACHKRGIRVPVYTTIQWDHFTSKAHPEWLILDAEGKPIGTPIYEAGFYRFLCVNSPYREFLRQHIREIFDQVPVDGLFLDIVQQRECSCSYCRKQMAAEGLDPSSPADRSTFAALTINGFKQEMTGFIRGLSSDCTIFYNAGHVGPYIRGSAGDYTHFELESLPSGSWGYLHFPLTARYARTLGRSILGMTGKFHTSWGDFHSYKNPAALQFECFSMLAQGAHCSIGDQLHPTGRLDRATYDLIGSVYEEVAAKEPWCAGARPVTEIAVLSPEEFVGGRLPSAALGAVRILQEGRHQFDVVDSQTDLTPYKVLFLPDVIPCDGTLTEKLQEFVVLGGSVIASFESGLSPDKTEFALNVLGVQKVSDGPRDSDGNFARGRYYPRHDYAEYVRPSGPLGDGLPAVEHVMYMRGLDVAPLGGTEILMFKIEPYFDRTWRHFCSHRQTPSSGRKGGPAAIRKGRCVYFSHPVFSQYDRNAPRWCRQIVLNALNLVLREPLLRASGPTTMIATVTEQPEQKRRMIHLLNYIPERRGEDFDIIEDVLPVYEIGVSLRADLQPTRIRTVPEDQELPFEVVRGRVNFRLPRLKGHQMIEIS